MSIAPDRRLHAYRDDLADASLRGRVDSARFVEGEPGHIAVPLADLRPRPDMDAGIDTQALSGEAVTIFERTPDWSWVRLAADGYVGYIVSECITPGSLAVTHRVAAPRTFVYGSPDLKRPVVGALSMGSRVAVVGETVLRGTRYAVQADGTALIASHLVSDDARAGDYLSIAARLLETPYLWGGRSGFGIDCSGLVQLSMMMAGLSAPRDSDMQESALGDIIDGGDRQAGDLVFWKGHVAMLESRDTLLHANGASMSVARENFADALRRIEPFYGRPTLFRRP
jgi:cell wall-associated NlpC family hydrolase